MTQDISKHPPGELEALEAHFGLRLTADLNAAAEELPHDISERLRFGREQTGLARQPQETSRAMRRRVLGTFFAKSNIVPNPLAPQVGPQAPGNLTTGRGTRP